MGVFVITYDTGHISLTKVAGVRRGFGGFLPDVGFNLGNQGDKVRRIGGLLGYIRSYDNLCVAIDDDLSVVRLQELLVGTLQLAASTRDAMFSCTCRSIFRDE